MTPEQLTGLVDTHLDPIARLHPEAAKAFAAMYMAAKDDGIMIDIASGFRDFERQRLIWNNKFNGIRPILDKDAQPLATAGLSIEEKGYAILRWSALPGTSRHHWGTDIDVYSKPLLPSNVKLQLEPWEYQAGGHQYALSLWLQQNAQQYGFFFPYRQDLGGVGIEPWHLSYAPVSQYCLSMLTTECIEETLLNQDIAGKEWVINHLDIIHQTYICNISG